MSVTNLDTLDDLGSFDESSDGGGGVGSPRQQRQSLQIGLPVSPASTRIPYYNPVGLTIGQTSPGARSLSSDISSYSRNQSHAHNAVHMHVQDNAKIPLFNQPVDRSNSSRPSYAAAPPQAVASGADTSNFSMAELFLKKESRHRHSLNLNYESLGALQEDGVFEATRRFSGGGTSKRESKLSPEEETQMEIDALTAAIDPTPWSEIERKIHKDQEKAKEMLKMPLQPPTHPHHYSYYPYGRHHQLPIPGKPPSPNNLPSPIETSSSNVMAQAVATAAAIASTQAAEDTVTQASSSPKPPITPSMSAPPYTKAQQTPAINTSGSSSARHFSHQRATYAAPQHAVAHKTIRASVLAAASQKSQYGFGGNHTVPSVPVPPPDATNGSSYKMNKGVEPVSLLPSLPNLQPQSHVATNSGAAYERKKQRAKDARVKLNEAIEHLSMAMSLAGSQSKQRNTFLKSRVPKTEHRTKTLQLSEECAKLAEQAKKWDRPSFVGTAASLVQSLNAQCESLVREVVSLQEQLDGMHRNNGSGPGNLSNGDQKTSHPGHKRHDHPPSSVNGAVVQATKRMRSITVNDPTPIPDDSIQHVDVSSDEKSVYFGVAKMLDPISLSRCPCVCRTWRDMKVFDDDDVWLNLAVKRFGFYNVRQWTEKLEVGDLEGKGVPKKILYREMNGANVVPHFQQEGISLLGDSKIPGRISGWVFMVERSNGETLRSVKCEPGTLGRGNGAYQSLPVVELRIVIQNTGMAIQPVVIKNQQVSVDISTRRSGGELKEIYWDERFGKVVKNLDGTRRDIPLKQAIFDTQGDLCRLGLFDAAILDVHINAKGCSTTSKFQQRSNFTKIIVCLDGTAVPLVIPFLRDTSHGVH